MTSASTEEIREGRWTAVEIRGSFVFVPCGEDEHLLHRHRQLRNVNTIAFLEYAQIRKVEQ